MESNSSTATTLATLSNGLAAAVERAGRAVVAIHGRPRTPSSGIHWREGVIVTADHTLKRSEEITITLPDGRTLPATLAGRDPGTDMAVLRLEAPGAATAEIGDQADLKVGQLVLALGRGEGRQSGPSASFGMISSAGASWHTWRGGQIDRFLALDLSIFLGFSGGPLVDLEGRVLGLNTTGLWRERGIAIPATTVERVTSELLAKGRIPRGYLGLGMQPVRLPETFRQKLGLAADTGLMVFTVEAAGPADNAGAVIGDVLVELDGRSTTDIRDIQAALGPEFVGRTVQAKVVRGGVLAQLAVTIGERPAPQE